MRINIDHEIRFPIRNNAHIKILLFNFCFAVIWFWHVWSAVIPRLRHRFCNNTFCTINRVLLIKLSTHNAITKFIIHFFRQIRISLNLYHRCNPICYCSYVIIERKLIRFNDRFFRRDYFICFALRADNSGRVLCMF